MGLTAKPSKNIDLAKIDDIQNEFFAEEIKDETKNKRDKSEQRISRKNSSSQKRDPIKEIGQSKKIVKSTKKLQEPTLFNSSHKTIEKPTASAQHKPITGDRNDQTTPKNDISENLKIADLLATAQFDGIRHTSRPYTMPRSLTIDLNRLKSKFRTRNLQYTQNELIDKMLEESLEAVSADNYFDLRERAFKCVKSPEQSSRRSVTLTEKTVSGMAELKADLAHAHGRRFSSDEIFTALLAIAFAPLYENGLL